VTAWIKKHWVISLIIGILVVPSIITWAVVLLVGAINQLKSPAAQ